MAWDVWMKVKVEGADVEGMSDRHVGGIDVNSFSWGMSQEVGDSGRLGKLRPQELQVSRFQDAVSPVFTQAMNDNANVDEIIFKSANERGDLDFEFTFKNCRVTTQQWSGAGSDVIDETLSFSYSELDMTANSYDDAGANKGSNDASWANEGAV